ncbi:hypothetical protein EGT36_01170 [Agrobacterium sp. FDAARGOS_525]|uniref:Tn3 transposase DDE domain-containing protein n=1 Tax=Agrobacterium genomosp. 2 str. CFBP 5494 TaxID=1183436 RepID=A0A9W5B6U0_9HYPH|nr:hypothetical protein EGT36_01170 [Agrobacterium sp. FDAARGOS_525]CUX02362.1 hypothetical protein AGR2A_pa60002 [Agrobacterium genomosp. 2 str. CFBP 5494]
MRHVSSEHPDVIEIASDPLFHALITTGRVSPDLVKQITPLGWRHIRLSGDYIWTSTESLDLRPLRRETSILAA